MSVAAARSSEIFREQWLRKIGVSCRLVRENQSNSKRVRTLRGVHFQLPLVAQASITVAFWL